MLPSRSIDSPLAESVETGSITLGFFNSNRLLRGLAATAQKQGPRLLPTVYRLLCSPHAACRCHHSLQCDCALRGGRRLSSSKDEGRLETTRVTVACDNCHRHHTRSNEVRTSLENPCSDLVLIFINTMTYLVCSLRGKICYSWH